MFDTNASNKYFANIPPEVPSPITGFSFSLFGENSYANIFETNLSISKERSITIGHSQVDAKTLCCGSFAYEY